MVASPVQAPAAIRYGLKDVATVTSAEIELFSDEEGEQNPKLRRSSLSIRPVPDVDTSAFDLAATHLISSPYVDLANHLTLIDLDQSSRLFAFALTQMRPIQPDYATAPYLETFNWPIVLAALRSLCKQQGFHWRRQEFHLVTFRSKRRHDADLAKMAELDKRSHEEASVSGGLLKYWFGSVDGEMRNLATCIWRNREDATAGGKGPWHRKARGAARDLYESIAFQTYRFFIDDGAERWWIEEHAA